ncbi:MAG: hypothetical protein IKD88_04495 [Lachnospiraceae bacterium]|nr:hypothetical protein [Lachnospiraceae bacterium]
MKKLLALLLAAAMILGLAACGNSGGGGADNSGGGDNAAVETGGGEEAGGEEAAVGATPNANPDGSINLDMVALVDPEYDYSQNPSFRVCYIASASTQLYTKAADYAALLCDQMNMEWMGFSSAEGDNDLYMTMLQQQLDAGYDIYILDPDSTIFPTVVALMDQYPEVSWITQMAPARDGAEGEGIPVGGNLLHPSIGFSNYEAGWRQMERLFEWINEEYPDADWSEVGCISMDYSLVPLLHERTLAAMDYWAENAPAEAQANIFDADCSAAGMTQQAAMDIVAPILTNNSSIRYWLIQGNMDDWAQGAATVMANAGLEETSCAVTFGGSNLEQQWDAGVQSCFRYALTSASAQYIGTCLGACYAEQMGWATMDELWPSWVKSSDHGGEGHTYATFLVPTFWEDYDTYQTFLEWTDLISGANYYDYDVEVSLDDYPIEAVVPDGYADT